MFVGLLVYSLYLTLLHVSRMPNRDSLQFRPESHQRNISDTPSAFLCYGRDYDADFYRRQSCMFLNLWFLRGSFYFVVGSVRDKAKLMKGSVEFEVDLGENEQRKDSKWSPDIVTIAEFTKLAGTEDAIFQAPAVSGTHVLYSSTYAEQFGDTLSDELYPIFSLLSAFGKLDQQVQLVRTSNKCDTKNQIVGKQQINCDENQRMRKQLFGDRVRSLDDFSSAHEGSAVRLDVLLAGTGYLNDHCDDAAKHGRVQNESQKIHPKKGCNQSRQATMWQFRNYILGKLGVVEATIPKSVERPRVIIWDHDSTYESDGKMGLLPTLHDAFERLRGAINERFGVECLLLSYTHESIVDQMRYVTESAIHITGPGPHSYMGWFLPHGSTMIRVYPTEASGYLEWHIMNYLPQFQVEHVVGKEGEFDHEEVLTLVEYALHRFQTAWSSKRYLQE